jgi:hypothetical protein
MFKNRLIELIVLGIFLSVVSWQMIIWIGGCSHALQEVPPNATVTSSTVTGSSTSLTSSTIVTSTIAVNFTCTYVINGIASYEFFGEKVASAGDINKDGKVDFLIGAPEAQISGMSSVGKVCIISGADGSTILFQKEGPGADPGADDWEGYGSSLQALGDINGDGYDDFAVGAQGSNLFTIEAGSVFIYSGKDGSLIRRFDGKYEHQLFGSAITSPASDKIVIGGRNNYNAVYGYKISDGTELFSPITAPFGQDFGYSAASTGFGRFLIGAPSANLVNVYFVSGSLVFPIVSPYPGVNSQFGWSLATADLNGDGRMDYIIGAPAAEGSGEVFAYSGTDGITLLLPKLVGEDDPSRFGWAVAAIGDVNGDGVPDFAVGAPDMDVLGLRNNLPYLKATEGGAVYIFSGADGSLLWKTYGEEEYNHLGYSIAALGDINGDGKGDFMVGVPGTSPGGKRYAGSVYVYTSN